MSSLSKRVEVLVVGSGPCGLLTALELARAGVEVEIIDRAWRSAEQSYACGLHASTVETLSRAGLERVVLDTGIRVESVGLYEGTKRQAELRMNEVSSAFPFLVVLPQDRLEEHLEEQLKARAIRVRWGHRLDDLRQDENGVTAVVEKLGVTSVGYPYARSEEAVEKEIEVSARFLVGADGCASHVRMLLGIPTDILQPKSTFEVYEFSPVKEAGREVRIAVAPQSIDVLWPQPGAVCRWSLQVDSSGNDRGETDRSKFIVLDEQSDRAVRDQMDARIRQRAPWFDGGIKEVDWTTIVNFEGMMARQFGVGRCYLVGDAGHQTGPVGMQSMNIGLREATDLAHRLTRILRESGSPELLREYQRERQAEWKTLLGGGEAVKVTPRTSPWIATHRHRLLSCLPGSGPELNAFGQQLGLEIPSRPEHA